MKTNVRPGFVNARVIGQEASEEYLDLLRREEALFEELKGQLPAGGRKTLATLDELTGDTELTARMDAYTLGFQDGFGAARPIGGHRMEGRNRRELAG